mmetsp:Transcript_10284/g.8835  ORF Transcript_10284/g.8835 Transcript_10284/m.8835 type:complete len:117 (-) Transcript_10284:322-672(-)
MPHLKSKLLKANNYDHNSKAYLPIQDTPNQIKRRRPFASQLTQTQHDDNIRMIYRDASQFQIEQIKYALKNLEKNYGHAICSFIISSISDPYLKPECESKGININQLKNWMTKMRR